MAAKKNPLKRPLDDIVNEQMKIIPDNWQGVSIGKDVKNAYIRAHIEAGTEFKDIEDKYKTHVNGINWDKYKKNTIDSLVAYVKDLGTDVENEELKTIKNDNFGLGKIKQYLTQGLVSQSGGKLKGENLTQEVEKKMREYLNPEKGKKPSREIFELIRVGAKVYHHTRIQEGIHLKHFGHYDAGQKEQLAAVHSHRTHLLTFGTQYVPVDEIKEHSPSLVEQGLQEHGQAYASMPSKYRVKPQK